MTKAALGKYTTPLLACALWVGGYALPHAHAKASDQVQAPAKTRAAKASASSIAAPKRQPAKPLPADTGLSGARYVAIGSSFAAGPMLPPPKTGAPQRCGQSRNNYPTLLAEHFGMVLVDRTCSGATTEHVLGPWGDIPPQLASVDTQTRLVTVTIGGNDLSYIGNLFSAACAFEARAVVATPGSKVRACGPVRVPTEADYVRDEAQMGEIARRIRVAAPQAVLVFVQYLTPLPRDGNLCAVTPVTEADASITREIGKRLTAITARVAQAHGATVVEMNQYSATHTPCDPVPWLIGWPPNYDGREGLQWHLNKLGMVSTAEAITAALERQGLRPVKMRITADPALAKPVPPVTAPIVPVTPAPSAPVSGLPPTANR